MKFAVVLFLSLMATQDASEAVSWRDYARATLDAAPTPWLVEVWQSHALPMPAHAWALDLGCGAGRDTHFLLAQGMRVTAIDANLDALDALQAQLPPDSADDVQLWHARFEDIDWSPMAQSLALVNATYALPFAQEAFLPTIIGGIANALLPGGLFVGQFFGHDNWLAGTTQQTAQQVMALFDEGFCFVALTEHEGLGPTAMQGVQHWHVYHVAARKKFTPSDACLPRWMAD